MTTSSEPSYPVTLVVDYPDRELSRLTTFFRIIMIIPIAIILAALGFAADTRSMHGGVELSLFTSGVLFIPVGLMIIFRQRYPRWWYDWNLHLVRFSTRVSAYLLLMDDEYPSTEDEQAVHLDFPYPDVPADLNRWLPIVKWLLAIPHYIVLFFLGIGSVIAVIVAWFAILFTGRYPRSLFDYQEGVLRWELRVLGYAFLLVTDQYPPFSLRG